MTLPQLIAMEDHDNHGFVGRNPKFLGIIGDTASLQLLAEKDFAFAHEGAVFVPATNELFMTSNRLEDRKGNDYITITKATIWGSAAETSCELVPWTGGYGADVGPSTAICMANGAANWGDDKILICAQGQNESPSGIYAMSSEPPYSRERLITDFYGRPFNSVSDVVVSQVDGSIWVTDPSYGFEQGFRPKPQLPDQVYRYDPYSGSIRVVADGFVHPNGLSFSPDEKTMYITDTGRVHGSGSVDDRKPATIYAYDVVLRAEQPFLANRRVFAMVTNGVLNGIKCDMEGNVYSGCGDGVNVWSPGGVFLGVIAVEGGVANFCFGRAGELFLLNKTRLWRARISPKITGALLRL